MPDTPNKAPGTPRPAGSTAGAASEILRVAFSHLGAGRKQAALELLIRAVAMEPTRLGTWFQIGRCRQALGQLEGAAHAYRSELELDPGDVNALNNLGVCCYEMERLDDAEACFRRAIELRPEGASSWNNLGSILLERGDPQAAGPFFEQALGRDPAYATAHSNLLMCEQYRVGVTPEGLKALSVQWGARFGGDAPKRPDHAPREARLLRIAFVSPDLGRTPVGYFLVGLLEALDPSEVRACLYSNAELADDLSERLRRAASLWREVRELNDGRLAEVAAADGIDIAVDLAGHTRGNRLTAFARRLAPVQVLWAGYAGTTGVPAIEYLIADRYQVPEDNERHYSEKVLRLPNDYVCYSPPSYAPPVGPLPAERNGCVTFAAFHNAGKIGAQSLRLWSGVLGAVPGARIVFKYKKLDDVRNFERIRRGFAEAGIDPTRITIEGTSPHLAMLARYADADIALDSLPYSGGLTTLEALWMGVPVVTLPGRTFAGRHSLTHIMNAGFPEFVAHDEAGYVRIAASLAGDLPRLAALRHRLRPAMAASPVCDTKRFARDFQAILAAIR